MNVRWAGVLMSLRTALKENSERRAHSRFENRVRLPLHGATCPFAFNGVWQNARNADMKYFISRKVPYFIQKTIIQPWEPSKSLNGKAERRQRIMRRCHHYIGDWSSDIYLFAPRPSSILRISLYWQLILFPSLLYSVRDDRFIPKTTWLIPKSSAPHWFPSDR